MYEEAGKRVGTGELNRVVEHGLPEAALPRAEQREAARVLRDADPRAAAELPAVREPRRAVRERVAASDHARTAQWAGLRARAATARDPRARAQREQEGLIESVMRRLLCFLGITLAVSCSWIHRADEEAWVHEILQDGPPIRDLLSECEWATIDAGFPPGDRDEAGMQVTSGWEIVQQPFSGKGAPIPRHAEDRAFGRNRLVSTQLAGACASKHRSASHSRPCGRGLGVDGR